MGQKSHFAHACRACQASGSIIHCPQVEHSGNNIIQHNQLDNDLFFPRKEAKRLSAARWKSAVSCSQRVEVEHS